MNPARLTEKLAQIGPSWLPSEASAAPSGPNETDAEAPLSLEKFLTIALAAGNRAPNRALAVFLMDQTKTSGIGNYVLSEVVRRLD